jgi:hypothetical protein
VPERGADRLAADGTAGCLAVAWPYSPQLGTGSSERHSAARCRRPPADRPDRRRGRCGAARQGGRAAAGLGSPHLTAWVGAARDGGGLQVVCPGRQDLRPRVQKTPPQSAPRARVASRPGAAIRGRPGPPIRSLRGRRRPRPRQPLTKHDWRPNQGAEQAAHSLFRNPSALLPRTPHRNRDICGISAHVRTPSQPSARACKRGGDCVTSWTDKGFTAY